MAETKIKSQKEYPNALPIGTILKCGTCSYTIEEVLGQGSYGITYKVSTKTDMGNIPVKLVFAVKENFTQKFCSRKENGITMSYPNELSEEINRDLGEFYSEGQKLNKICKKSENIVKVNETWKENGTAYYAMEFIDGENLDDYVKGKGRLSEEEALEIFLPILEAVRIVHENHILHLDIKPENIMLEKQKEGNLKPILIDFGISLRFNERGEMSKSSKDHSTGLSEGYAPIEQYSGISHFAPEVDVYALGATLYYMLSGKRPKKAADVKIEQIKSGLPDDISDDTKKAILHAMNKIPDERTPTAIAFKNELHESSTEPYRLKIGYVGEGKVQLGYYDLHTGMTYQYVYNPQNAIKFLPQEGYKTGSVRVNNRDVTNKLCGNALTLTKQDTDVDLYVEFVKEHTVKYVTKMVTVQSTGNGRVYYGTNLIHHSSQTFEVKTGTSFLLYFTPDEGSFLKSIKVNNIPVSFYGKAREFTISKVTSDTIIEVSFSNNNVIPSPGSVIYKLLKAVAAILILTVAAILIVYAYDRCSSPISTESSEEVSSVVNPDSVAIEQPHKADSFITIPHVTNNVPEKEEMNEQDLNLQAYYFDEYKKLIRDAKKYIKGHNIKMARECIKKAEDKRFENVHEKKEIDKIKKEIELLEDEESFENAKANNNILSLRELALKGYIPACKELAYCYIGKGKDDGDCRAWYWARKADEKTKKDIESILQTRGFFATGADKDCDNLKY